MQHGRILKMPLENNQQVTSYRPSQSVGGASQTEAIFNSLLSKKHTLILCEVMTVEQAVNEVSEVGFLSIRPMVFMVDGSNNTYSRGTINKVPFFRIQSGGNALIINPQVGDIGLAAFCERDISMVKRTRKQAAPNSRSQFDLNDAVYLGGFLNGSPTQYIHFLQNGINIKTTGNVDINGLTIGSDGKLTLANGVVVDTHIHNQGNDSAGNTQQPTGVPENG